MTDKEKVQKIGVAYNAIRTVFEDTDKKLWAYEYLGNAIVALDEWFEEWDI